MAIAFEVLFPFVSLLAVVVLLRRVRQLEHETNRRPEQPTPPAVARNHDLVAATYDMLYSPLLVILGQCELAASATEDGDASGHAFRFSIIERQARRMRDLLERQYRPASVPAPVHGHRELEPGRCLRAAVDQWAGRALERGVHVHFVIDDTPTIRANPTLLAHALRHLVGAAIEAAPEGAGDVTVAAGELDGEILFAVADDGPGLDANELANLFRPTELDQDGEVTLSYSIVYALAHALGGGFVLDTGPGAGTRATLKVPLVAAQAEAALGSDEAVDEPASVSADARATPQLV